MRTEPTNQGERRSTGAVGAASAKFPQSEAVCLGAQELLNRCSRTPKGALGNRDAGAPYRSCTLAANGEHAAPIHPGMNCARTLVINFCL